jgi:hypothetical protein
VARHGTDPITVSYPGHDVAGVTAQIPTSSLFIGSSLPASSQCGTGPQSAPGFTPPEAAIAAEQTASPATATVALPSNPYSKSYGGTGADSQTTESFHARLRVTTSGDTSGPGAPAGLTPAQVQAKRNALDALRQTLPAALYPCFSTSLGTTLVTGGPAGAAVGGTLIAVGGPLCVSYYAMITAEIRTVRDPPRSDYGVVARPSHDAPASRARPAAGAAASACRGRHGAILRACRHARAAAAKLLAATRSTAALARAVEITIARESGAKRDHRPAAARRQNHALTALIPRFRHARKAQAQAGAALMKVIRHNRAAIRLSEQQVAMAIKRLRHGLAQRGLSAANRRYADSLIKPHGFDVLDTLGH